MPRHQIIAVGSLTVGCGITALIALLLAGCDMSNLTRVTSEQFPQPESCSECHVDIYREWAASPHTQAFINPRYVTATDNHAFEQCLPCHAPQPMMALTEPAVRPMERDLGVTCVSCHLNNGVMVGPLPPTGFVKPHPIRIDPAPFENGKLCGSCHQGTLAQWQAAKRESSRDCRECHMPSILRKTTQATSTLSWIFVSAEKAVREHQHSFTMIPSGLPEAPATLDVICSGGEARITLTNRLPHNLPTGDFGVRIIEVSAEGVDSQQQFKPLAHWELTNAAAGFLAAGESRQWSVAVPAAICIVRITVTRYGRDNAGRVELLRKEVVVQ